jgi:hypothetical protein
MTEPGDKLAAGAGGQGHLQASHADREEAIDMLKIAFVQGRLDWDEFDLRVSQALASRTYADLAALITDIPTQLVRPPPPERIRESVSKKAVVATACATAALVGLLPVMMLRPPFPSFVLPLAVLWFALTVAVPAGWIAVFQDWLDKRPAKPVRTGSAASQRQAPAGSCG